MREFGTWAVIILVFIVVAVIAGVSGVDSHGGLFRSMGFHEGGTQVSWLKDSSRVEVRYTGAIAVSDDDRDILEITPRDYLSIIEEGFGFGVAKKLELRGRADKTIERKYIVDGRETPYEPEGKAWLEEMLPDVVRRSGLAAQARLERILKAQGVAGVLAEISLLESDFVKRVYFSILFEKANLAGADLAQAISHAGQTVSSDYELGQLLKRIIEHGNLQPTARDAFFDAALSIDSDYEMANLLIRVADANTIDAAFRGPYFKALATIDSDYEHRRVLSELTERVSDPAILSAMIESTKQINSNYEAAQFLVEFAEHQPFNERLRAMYLEAANRLPSDHERNRALSALEQGR
jgi:hypothetical protein